MEVTDYCFGAEVSDTEIEELVAWDTQVAEEDVSLVQSVQQGLGPAWCSKAASCRRASSSSRTSSAASTTR
jgi:hypothetical protein